jgi:hypothetical protein
MHRGSSLSVRLLSFFLQGAGYSTSKYEPGLHGAAAAAHDRKVEREQGGGQ